MRRLLRSVTTLSAVLLASSAAGFATGCSSSSDTTAPSSQVAGTYLLRTLNGVSLPVQLQSDGSGTYQLVSDTFTFNGDGTFTEQFVENFTATGATTPTPLTENDSGTWRVSGTNVVLTFMDSSGLTGAFTNGNTITFVGGGSTAVYQK